MDDIRIVKYAKSDCARFSEFARRSFHPKYILSDEKFLDWQYLSPGAELALAKRGEEIVGFFGYKDFDYKIYGETKRVRAVMNLFADEKYRMAGVGPMLARHVFDTKNYILVSSYNDAAQKLYRHLRPNWVEAGDLNRYMAVLGGHELLKEFKVVRLPRADSGIGSRNDGLVVEKIAQILNEFDEFWHGARKRYPVTIERTSEYLKWRYLKHPFFDYQILAARHDGKLAGFLVYRFEEVGDFKIARIIDFASVESAEVALLNEFLDRARAAGAQAADFMFSGPVHREALVQVGFFDVTSTDFAKFPIRFNPLSYSKFVINIAYDIPAPLADCYLTKGDSDQDRPNPH